MKRVTSNTQTQSKTSSESIMDQPLYICATTPKTHSELLQRGRGESYARMRILGVRRTLFEREKL